MQKINAAFLIIFCALSVIPISLFSATLDKGRYSVEIMFQKPNDPNEEQKIIHLEAEQELVSPLRLFYSREVNLEKISEADYIQIEFQDLRSFTIVETDRLKPMLATVVVTDGGAILMGYVVTEESFLKEGLKLSGIFRYIDQVNTLTHKEDVTDSLNYPLEYSKEYLWYGVQEGDYVKYWVSEDRPYGEIVKVTKVHESSLDLEIINSEQKEPKKVSVDWKVYPKIDIKSILSFETIKLDRIFIQNLAEKKKLSVEVFEFEIKKSDGKHWVFSFSPSLFPLAFVQELNGVVQIKDSNKKIIRKITDVSRLRMDEGKKELDKLSLEEKEALRTDIKKDSSEFLSILQKEHLRADNIDQFVAMDELFIQLDGFPLAFSEMKTAQEKIQEMEEQVDERFDQLENDLRLCQKKIAELEDQLKNALPKQHRILIENDLHDWEQRLQMLKQLSETPREEVKRQKRERYLERYHQEGLSKRNVISNELSLFFRKVVPSDMNVNELLKFGRFRLISPSRATISFPKSNVLIYLKRYGSTWKVCALINH